MVTAIDGPLSIESTYEVLNNQFVNDDNLIALRSGIRPKGMDGVDLPGYLIG